MLMFEEEPRRGAPFTVVELLKETPAGKRRE